MHDDRSNSFSHPQLEELERMQSEALRRCGVAKYNRLRTEFQVYAMYHISMCRNCFNLKHCFEGMSTVYYQE